MKHNHVKICLVLIVLILLILIFRTQIVEVLAMLFERRNRTILKNRRK